MNFYGFLLGKGFHEKCKYAELALNFIQKQKFSPKKTFSFHYSQIVTLWIREKLFLRLSFFKGTLRPQVQMPVTFLPECAVTIELIQFGFTYPNKNLPQSGFKFLSIKKTVPLKIYLNFFFTVISANIFLPKCYTIYFFFKKKKERKKKSKGLSFRTFRETCFGRILDRHFYIDTIQFRRSTILIPILSVTIYHFQSCQYMLSKLCNTFTKMM